MEFCQAKKNAFFRHAGRLEEDAEALRGVVGDHDVVQPVTVEVPDGEAPGVRPVEAEAFHDPLALPRPGFPVVERHAVSRRVGLGVHRPVLQVADESGRVPPVGSDGRGFRHGKGLGHGDADVLERHLRAVELVERVQAPRVVAAGDEERRSAVGRMGLEGDRRAVARLVVEPRGQLRELVAVVDEGPDVVPLDVLAGAGCGFPPVCAHSGMSEMARMSGLPSPFRSPDTTERVEMPRGSPRDSTRNLKSPRL